MFIGVIRGDLSQALFLSDLEPKSQSAPTVEPAEGQNAYITRPSPTKIQAYLDAQSLAASATVLITATVPVGGPLNVASATITGVAGLGAATPTQVAALQNLLAYKIVETDVAKKSFLFGNIAGYRSSSFNPDPRRMPAIASSAAIAVVADDGSTAFAVAQPVVTTADLDTPAPGALRITGTGLAGYGMYEFGVTLTGAGARKLTQAQILEAGGSINTAGTQIDIPAVLIPGAVVGSTYAKVRVNDMASAAVVLT